jgi:choice-of-anchor B domain-containing protein
VALSETLALVGAPGHAQGRGIVHVFQRDVRTGAWTPSGTVQAGATEAGDRFGTALWLDGDRLLVGAPGPVSGPAFFGSRATPRAGAAYAFRFDARSRTWREEARLAAADTSVAFGAAVHLVGGDALVGAPATENGAGAVYRLQADARSGTWRQTARLAPATQQPNTFFGMSLARAGRDVLVGAPAANGLHGMVFAFRESADGAWTEAQRIEVPGLTLGASLGAAVAAAGDVAILGAPGGDFFEGTGYVFARDAGTGEWRSRGTIVDDAAGLQPIVGGTVRCENGTARVFSCGDVDLVSFLPVSAIGGTRGIQVNDLWGWTDPDSRREYAIVGRFDGTAFVDITDPVSPVYLGNLPLHQGAVPNLWRDIKVYANHAFIVSDGAGPHGVQVFDLTQLRSVRNPPVTFSESAHYDRIHSAHNIVINEATGFAYVVGASMGGETCGGALHMVDIRDPKHPAFAGCFADPNTGNARTGYTHDAMCVVYGGPDVEHQGKEICFGANETALSIADVSDKQHPVALSSAAYPNVAYAHQGWISDDHRYFFLDDEGDELSGTVPRTRTLVWDVQDLDDPVILTEYLGETAATDHNLYVKGHYIYESNYVSGLRVIDISDPANPHEVAYFDTVPFGQNAPGFAGSWSNYPFFASGNLIVSSMREGLFVLRHRETPPIP